MGSDELPVTEMKLSIEKKIHNKEEIEEIFLWCSMWIFVDNSFEKVTKQENSHFFIAFNTQIIVDWS